MRTGFFHSDNIQDFTLALNHVKENYSFEIIEVLHRKIGFVEKGLVNIR